MDDVVLLEGVMAAPRVWAFFYGSFISLDVLSKVGCIPERYEVARLGGFDIHIRPLANLVRGEQTCVYGLLATATHDELRRLYEHARDELGGTYLPEAVLVETLAGTWRPALCYLAPALEPAAASNDYIDRIVHAARMHGFPGWYVSRLEAFRPQGDSRLAER
jgi:hypothetical protein